MHNCVRNETACQLCAWMANESHDRCRFWLRLLPCSQKNTEIVARKRPRMRAHDIAAREDLAV
eukprot:scaffold313878_cov39-Prasinocladus_malaysianus.AAC.1